MKTSMMLAAAVIVMLAMEHKATVAGEVAGAEVRFDHSSVRLLSGGWTGSKWDSGVEISMGKGWKTYWRVPGASGVPPSFDWEGSINLKAVHIDWPAPTRYLDQAGESIGYKDRVVFPMWVEPADAAQPVTLKLDLFYAVCDEICIPGSAKLAHELSKSTANDSDRALISEFRKRAPLTGRGPIDVVAGTVASDEDGHALAVTLTGLDSPEAADVFVEGADAYYFRQPRHMGHRAGGELYYLHVDGLEAPGDLAGRTVELTITTPSSAVARRVTIE